MKTAVLLKYLQSGLPLISTLKEYRLAWLSKDAIAGLSACIVSIPSVIAYAELVHLPAITGLYAALAAAVGYALFASSRHVIAGPDAAIGLLAGSAILPLAAGESVAHRRPGGGAQHTVGWCAAARGAPETGRHC